MEELKTNEAQISILSKLRNDSLAKWRPLQASLELTFRCNERCTHCYLEKYTDDPTRILSFEQWKKILGELREAGVLYLILMGGEAMLNPHFWDISSEAVRLGFSLSMITNGLKITEPVARRLAGTGFSHVTISLYSMHPEIHDSMTAVKGSHAKTMAAIQHLLNVDMRLGVNCLLTKNNIEGFFELADWCIERKMEIKADVTVTPKFNGDLSPTYLRAGPDQLRAYYKKLSEKWPGGLPKPSTDGPQDYICNAGKGKCAVTPYGELLTCIEVRESLGLLTEKPFAELWASPTAQKWRSFRLNQLEGLKEGDGTGFCEHCPGMAQHETGNPLKVSGFFRDLAKIKEEAHLGQTRKTNGWESEKS